MSTDDACGCRSAPLGQRLAPQILYAGADRLEVVGCSGL